MAALSRCRAKDSGSALWWGRDSGVGLAFWLTVPMTNTIDAPKLNLGRLPWVGPATVCSSVLAVLIVQGIAAALLSPLPKGLGPLTSIEPTVVTIVMVSGAVLVFAVVGHEALDPFRTYRRIALVVLMISFVPDVGLAMTAAPGINLWPLATIFMVMHVAAWAVTVTMLTRLTSVQRRANCT
jgi:hypothetical protein